MATDKQERFACEYVKDYNGTQAAVRAGYSPKTAAAQACRLLKNPDVLKKVKDNQTRLVEESCLTEEKVIIKLMEVLDMCMAAVPVEKWDYTEHKLVETGEYQFDSKGALNALKMLGDHLGMYTGKLKSSDEGSGETLKQFINALNGKANEVWKEE